MPFKTNTISKYSEIKKSRDLSRNRSNLSSGTLPCLRVASADDDSDERLIRYSNSYDTSQDYSLTLPSTSIEDSTRVVIKTYKRRFWIIFIFSLLTWFSCVQWNAWGPISESMFAAFPDWNTSTVAMMENWVTLLFVCSVLPVCWLTGRIGLRSGTLISSLLLAVGLALRCITDTSPLFTIMCHLCSVLLGISMTVILSVPPMIASVWFPQNERTSAVAVTMAAAHLGTVGNYLEPLIVRDPSDNVPTSFIKYDIMMLIYVVAAVGVVVFLLILAYFPSKPPLPPSFTSTTERLDFKNGLRSVMSNRNFVAFLVIYGIAVGPSLGWIGVLNFSLKILGFSQDDAMFVGLVAVVGSFVTTLITGWFTDRVYGHLRETIIALLLAASLSYYWFFLLSRNVLTFSRWQVFVSVTFGVSLNFATIPLFLELAVEIAYPVPEVLVGGLVTASDCLSTSVFLFMYFFKSIGFEWVSYTLVASNAVPVLALLFIKTKYSRFKLDSPERQLEYPS